MAREVLSSPQGRGDRVYVGQFGANARDAIRMRQAGLGGLLCSVGVSPSALNSQGATSGVEIQGSGSRLAVPAET